MPQDNHLNALFQRPVRERSIWYNGHTFSFLADRSQTHGAFALLYCYFRKGEEAPAQINGREDECYYLLDGAIKFCAGTRTFIAKAGDLVLLPKGLPHHHILETDTAKALLLFTPAGFETYFTEFGKPAPSMELPPLSEQAANLDRFKQMAKRAQDYGIRWVPQF
jgi:quercetin dioxygenase-like cupin family protein